MFDWISKIFNSKPDETVVLSDEEKKLLDVRLEELEKHGPKGISLDEFRAKINDRYGI